jgi:hypothetical protein
MARRLVAILACLLLAQLTLAASGWACVAGAAHPRAAAATTASGATVPDTGAPHCAPGGEAPAPAHDCGSPWGPGGCAAMTACAPALVPSVAAIDAPTAPAQRIAPLDALAPPSRATIPEAPPPRA